MARQVPGGIGSKPTGVSKVGAAVRQGGHVETIGWMIMLKHVETKETLQMLCFSKIKSNDVTILDVC